MKVPYKSITFWIFFGLFSGMACGKLFGESIVPLGGALGDIFLRFLRMAIMPLIIASIVSGVVSVGNRKSLGLGLKTFGYYVISSLMAILTGQILVNLFKPGVGANILLEETPSSIPAIEQSVGNIVVGIIPENPFQSLAEGRVLPVIFFSILLGYFITQTGEPYRSQLGDFFDGLFDVMMRLTRMVVWTAPIGVFGINAKIVATTGFEAFKSLGFYFVVVLIGLPSMPSSTSPS